MSKAYLFLYDDVVGSREQLKAVLSAMPQVTTWRFDLPHCFYVISPYSAGDLYNAFIQMNGKKGRFMFIEASTNSQGLMLPDTWYLLTHKTHKPSNA